MKLPSLTPVGDVVLDLNGHTIDIKNWYKKKEPTNETMFVIGSGAKLTVLDSKGQGKIHADSYISAPEDFENPNVYDIFQVTDGELVINAAGAEFECGRSKKQWIMSNIIGASYHGWARNQVCGSVIKVEDNAKVTIAGGTLKARGYERTECLGYFFDPCAVIKGLGAQNVTVNILDGILYGKGNAGVLQLAWDADVTIRAGKFDTFQLDRVVTAVMDYGSDEGQPTVTGAQGYDDSCMFGTIGIRDGAFDPDNADVIVGGHNYSEDENEKGYANKTQDATTVQPKSNKKTAEKRIEISRDSGVNAWNLSTETSFIIKAKNGREYFTDADRVFLSEDLQSETLGYYLWKFTLYDAKTGKACDAQTEQMASLTEGEIQSFDIASFKDKDGTPFDFKGSGIDSYKVKVEVEEHWEGENSYCGAFFNWYYFTLSEIDTVYAAQVMDFDITPTKGTLYHNRYVLETNTTEEAMEFYFETGTEVFCDIYYQFYTLDSGGNTVLSSKQNVVTNLDYGEGKTFGINTVCVGPIQVTVEYKFMHADGETYDVVSVKKPVFALSALKYQVVAADDEEENVLREDTIYSEIKKAVLSEGESIIIEPGFPARLSAMDVVDPKTGKTFDINNIRWQSSVTSDADGNNIWNDVSKSDIVVRDIDGVMTPCVKTNRSALYRVCYTWAGKEFAIPQSLNLEGVNYGTNRQLSLTSDKSANIYGGGNQFTVTLNREADWFDNGSSIKRITIKNVAKPDGAKLAQSAKIIKEFSGIEDTRTFSLDSDVFFEDANTVTAGEYSFVAVINGVNASGTGYTVTSPVCTISYANAATDVTLKVDGYPIYDPEETQIPYILPADTNTFRFTCSLYPEGSTPDTMDLSVKRWSSSNTDILEIDYSTGDATAKAPGTVTVTYSYYSEKDKKTVKRTATVIVPIAGFKLKPIDYVSMVGKKASTVTAEVEAVWSYGGEKIYKNAGSYLTAKLTSSNGWGGTSVNFTETVIDYNTTDVYGWTIAPTADYFFPVKKETYDRSYDNRMEIEYNVDTELLACNGLEDGEMAPADSYDARVEWTYPYQISVNLKDHTYTESYKERMYIDLYHTPAIEHPDGVYLKEVNITVNEPAVGDNRYEGTTYKPMNEYMVLNVSGLLGGRKTDDSHSYVSKLDLSKMKGTGKAYDDASGEDSGVLASEYMSVWNTTSDYSEWYKPTKTYEDGIYVHDVQLRFDSAGDDGMKIYLARDANVFVNGRLMDYAGISYYNKYSSDESTVSFKYYFDVGQVDTVTQVEVTGIQQPRQGEMPIRADDVIVKTDENERDDIDVALLWFVDDNENGKYDSGEEAKVVTTSDDKYDAKQSTLWYDGSFLPGTRYSAYVEFDSGAVRLDADMRVSYPLLSQTSRGTSAVLSFDEDQWIRTISFATAEGKDAADPAKRDPQGLADANPGYLAAFEVYSHKEVPDAATDAAVSTFLQGEDLSSQVLTEGKYWLKMTFTTKSESYKMADDVCVLINGVDYGEEFADGRKNIVVERSKDKVTAYYCFRVPNASGVTVSGTAVSFGSDTDDVIIQLVKSGMSDPAYQAVIKGNSESYSITGVAEGSYIMKVMKNSHATREYTITADGSDITQDVKIHLKGDINGDGKVNTSDVGKANSHTKGTLTLTGYELSCADVNGDGKVNTSDVGKMNAHVKGTSNLW